MRPTAEQVNSCYRIWHKLYPIIIPYYATRTKEDLDLRGMIYTTNSTEEEKEQWRKRPVTVNYPIWKHLQLYDDGIAIAYPNWEIAVKVYEELITYVKVWDHVLNSNFISKKDKALPTNEEFEIIREYVSLLDAYVDWDLTNKRLSDIVVDRRKLNILLNDNEFVYREGSDYQQAINGDLSMVVSRTLRVDDKRGKMRPPPLPNAKEDLGDMNSLIQGVRNESSG